MTLLSNILRLAALAAFAAANIIHNEYRGVDAAIAPATLFTVLMLWKPRRVFIVLAAIFVALPAFRFFNLAALADVAQAHRYFNHLFLLLSGVLAVTAGVLGLLPARPADAGRTAARIRYAGLAAMFGGVLAVAVTPLMVMVKYATGWSIIPRPAWTFLAGDVLDPLVSLGTPVQMWVAYGAIYTVALLLMLAGLAALCVRTMARGDRPTMIALSVVLLGLCLVIPGDALHTATWHLGGATLPRPGLNQVASTGFAMALIGEQFVLAGSFAVGIVALFRKSLDWRLAWLFVAVAPSAVLLTMTTFPTLPSGAFWVFSIAMIVAGRSLRVDHTKSTRWGNTTKPALMPHYR
jgi:hypothetical protein